MLLALTTDNQPVTANNILKKKASYYCPSCKSPVYLKRGQVIRPHFAHYRREKCFSFSEGETAEHLKGKLDLFHYFKKYTNQVQLEAYLPEIEQRPDILITDQDKKIAIEYQCSSIAIEKMIERTDGYKKANYHVLWILGENFSYHKKLTDFQQASLYYDASQNDLYLLNYKSSSEKLMIHYNFHLNSNGEMISQLVQNQLNNIKMRSFLKELIPTQINSIQKTNQLKEHRRLLRAMRYPSPDMLDFLALLYQAGDNIVSAPVEIYQHLPSEWLFQNYHMHWKYQLISWLEAFNPGQIITEAMLKDWSTEGIKNKRLKLIPLQAASFEIILKVLVEFMDYLWSRNILKKEQERKWIYQQPAKRFSLLEEKLFEK